MCTGVEPRKATTHLLNMQVAALQINSVHICNLKFSSVRWRERGSNFANPLIVEIKAGHCPVGSWILGFLLEMYCATAFVEVHYTIVLRLFHLIRENGCAFLARRGPAHQVRQSVPVKEIVTQYQCPGPASEKLATKNKGLRKPVRSRLHN